jgi:two-component system cell cycle sensor histidine kinase/response regulator CckA
MAIFVLLVDHEEDVRSWAAKALRNEGFSVLEAADAPSAIAYLGEYPAINVLVIDVGFPGGNGFALASIAVRLSPRIHVLYTSGRVRPDDQRRDGTIPAAMLAKPYSMRRLVAAVWDAYRTPLGTRGRPDVQPPARLAQKAA